MKRTLPSSTEHVVEVAGSMARAGGRPLCDCPYDPDRGEVSSAAYAAWCRGWKGGANPDKIAVEPR